MTAIQYERIALLRQALSQRIFIVDVKAKGGETDISFYAFNPKLTLNEREEVLLIETGAIKMSVDITELKVVKLINGPVLCELKLVLYQRNKEKEGI